jgi:hypothetical protein
MWRRPTLLALAVLFLLALPAHAQARRTTKRPPPKPAAPKVVNVPADMACPSVLGTGVATKRQFCDVFIGRDPAGGILIKLPPHRGPLTLSFDLYNRHAYSEEQVRQGRAYRSFTASIGVLTMDNTLISRAVVQSEFRTARDLFDRVSGGAGPGGVKAVAPTGLELISVAIPEKLGTEKVDEVSILGEKLTVTMQDGSTDTYVAQGRPVAVISNVMVEYTPAPVKKPPAKRKRAPEAHASRCPL